MSGWKLRIYHWFVILFFAWGMPKAETICRDSVLFNGSQVALFDPNDWPGTVSTTTNWGDFGQGIRPPYILIAGQKSGSDSWQSSWNLPPSVSLQGRSFSFSIHSTVAFTWSFRLRDQNGLLSSYISHDIPANKAVRISLPASGFSGINLDRIVAVQMELLNVNAWTWMNIILDSVSLDCSQSQPSPVIAKDSAVIRLTTAKVKQESNYVQYVVTVRNSGVHSVEPPVISYFARYEPTLSAAVDYSNPSGVQVQVQTPFMGMSRIDFSLPESLGAGQQVEFHARIYKQDWSFRDFASDWSHQNTFGVFQPNPLWTVRDSSGRLYYGNDPLTGERISEIVIWYGSDGSVPLYPYIPGESNTLGSSRTWLLAEDPLTGKELENLATLGLQKMEGTIYQGHSLYLMTQTRVVELAELNKVVSGFYTAWPAEPARAPFYVNSDSAGKKSYEVEVHCWPDIDESACLNQLRKCYSGAVDSDFGDPRAILDSGAVACLLRQTGIRHVNEVFVAKPLNDQARQASGLNALQQGPAWNTALAAEAPTENWLKNTPYTGEGVVVGVYDTGLDWDHPDFNEQLPDGTLQRRRINENEIHSPWPAAIYSNMQENDPQSGFDYQGHGTHVTGIVGGNGWASPGYRWRGVAPKVRFFAGKIGSHNRTGHVANHSSTMSDTAGLYCYSAQLDDSKIFDRYGKSYAPRAEDTLVKTVVAAAGNEGTKIQHTKQKGYHSAMTPAKNPILVGNYSSRTGKRHPSSSMGPTWDGRIKPDVMAPGSQRQDAFTEEQPLHVYVDYVRLYRRGASQPYWQESFNNLNSWGDRYGGEARIVSDDPQAAQGSVLYWRATSGVVESYLITQRFETALNVLANDELEISIRAEFPDGRRTFLSGDLMMAQDPLNPYKQLLQQNVTWNLNENGRYRVNRIPVGYFGSVWFLRLSFHTSLSMQSTFPTWGPQLYSGFIGTSMAAPHVTGIVALMLQKYRETTGLSLEKYPLHNSTTKAILIHTATDMVDTVGDPAFGNPDHAYAMNDGNNYPVRFHRGPDFATGWGKVNAEKVLQFVDTTRFRELGVAHGEELQWTLTVPAGQSSLRVTAVWDDAPGSKATEFDYQDNRLVNDLDLALLSPSGNLHYPWRLAPLPVGATIVNAEGWRGQGVEPILPSDVTPAYRHCPSQQEWDISCFDRRNNVEVVDVDQPEAGRWTVILRGTRVVNCNMDNQLSQRVSVVADRPLGAVYRSNAHPYPPNQKARYIYGLGNHLSSQVTFSIKSCLGKGDTLRLYTQSGTLLGAYTDCQLAGMTLEVIGSQLIVELESDSEDEGYGFAIDSIQGLVPSILPLLWQGTIQHH